MSYLENILVCIVVPFLLALLFVKGKQKEYPVSYAGRGQASTGSGRKRRSFRT